MPHDGRCPTRLHEKIELFRRARPGRQISRGRVPRCELDRGLHRPARHPRRPRHARRRADRRRAEPAMEALRHEISAKAARCRTMSPHRTLLPDGGVAEMSDARQSISGSSSPAAASPPGRRRRRSSERIPLVVTLVPVPPPPDALADRSHARCRRSPSSTPTSASPMRIPSFAPAAASASAPCSRLGRRPAHYVHAYGEYGKPLCIASFHQHWVRAALRADPALVRRSFGRRRDGAREPFRPSRLEKPGSPLGDFTYGLQISPSRYREMMRAHALHLGVVERPRRDRRRCSLRGADGFVDLLSARRRLGGRAATSMSIAPGPCCVFVLLGGGGRRFRIVGKVGWPATASCSPRLRPRPELPRARQSGGGAKWAGGGRLPRSSAPRTGSVYAAGAPRRRPGGAWDAVPPPAPIAPDGPAVSRCGQGEAGRAVAERVSSRSATRLSAVEPLEWTNLHLAHNAIDRIVAMMPDRDCKRGRALGTITARPMPRLDRVRDFLLSPLRHLRGASEPFWRDARNGRAARLARP